MLLGIGFMAILIIIPLWAQARVKRAYHKYSKVSNTTGLTGAEVARKILDDNGLFNVSVREVQGRLNDQLSDHYDPRSKTVNLSSAIYHGTSIAGTAVAAHEVGHAIQDAKNYAPLRFRHSLVPVANLGSQMAFPLILFGVLFSMTGLALLGVVFFAAAVLFQIVTLPVEFNASSRAMNQVVSLGIIDGGERKNAKTMLDAAAMTYVAATLVAVLQLLWFLLSFVGMNED
ncbi:MAG TPA: zinc metallopeptidase [Bacillales bacterium]|nr:zinc metallopeptidase [Bacillales bacterium]